jgi:hypothetical protein
MRLTDLPVDELDGLSSGQARTRAGWLVSIEEHSPDLEHGDLEVDLPVAARPFRRLARGEDCLVVEYEDRLGHRASYTIPQPFGLRQVLHPDPTVELRVEGPRGTTLICLRRAR